MEVTKAGEELTIPKKKDPEHPPEEENVAKDDKHHGFKCIIVLETISNHVYRFGGKVFKQQDGGPI